MYEKFYRLTEAPFRLTPDHRYFFASSGHKRALGYLTFGLSQGEGFVVITGEVGAGKTTLVAHLLATLDPARFVTATVVTTHLNADDMVRMVAAGFGLSTESPDKATILVRLHAHLKHIAASGRRAVIIVDEAQNLPLGALEELRMLSNLQLGQPQSFQMLLLGQPEFRNKIVSADLAQLRQRIIATYHLGPITAEETREYVRHRLVQAGWQSDPTISPDAFAAIYYGTRGVPRLINVLCSRIFLYAYLEQLHAIDGKVVQEVTDDMRSEFDGWRPQPVVRAAATGGRPELKQ